MKKDEHIIAEGGKERQVDNVAILMLVMNIILAITTLVLYKYPVALAMSIVLLISGISMYVILTAFAEIIRIQKSIGRLEYDGEISEPKEKTFYTCSSCKCRVSETATVCYECKTKLE